MRKFLEFYLVYSILISKCFCQIPANLVPNFSFEESIREFDEIRCITRPVETNVSFWHRGWEPKNEEIPTDPNRENNSPNWRSFLNDKNADECYPCENKVVNAFLDDKYVFMGCDIDTRNGENIFTPLHSKLEIGKKYKFRVLAYGTPNSHFNIHISKKGKGWNAPSSASSNLMNVLGFSTSIDRYEDCRVKAYEGIISADKDELEHIILHAVSSNPIDQPSYIVIDRVELYEHCTDLLTRQGRIYKYKTELDEANYIMAGSVIDNNPAMGDVEMLPGSVTVYKANTEVKLVEGFNVYRGGDFTAKIAPCGSNCRSSNISLLTDYTICDNECITLGGPSVLGMSYSWSAVTDEHLQYLSSTTVAKPVFCPPDGGSGTYTYNLTITNTCGESTTKTVYVHYDNESNPNPKFAITNSNLASNPDNPSLTINTVQHTEYVSVDILDCNNNILHSNTYKNGVDFTAPQEVNWQFGGFMSPCGCYKIRVRSKNYCYEDVKEEMLQWNRITTPTNVQFENFTRCEGGKRKIWFSGSGVASVKLQLFNRKGLRDVSNTYNITGNPYCMEIPNDNEITNGQYAIIIDFIGCDGTIKNMTGFVSVFPCGDSFTDGGGTWNGDDYYNGGVYYENPENGTIDSLYSVLSPNPVLEGALITYHIPEAGSVKITLLNANFEQKAILVQNETMSAGDYQVQFSNAYLLNGVNYYMIELSNNQQARHIKRFSVVK
jgi:hypothetical protein